MNRGIVLFFCVLIVQILNAAPIDSIFIHTPNQYLPLLNEEQRFELINKYKINPSDSLKNKLGGFAQLLDRDTLNNRITARLTQNSEVQIQLFRTTDKSNLIGVIHTVCAPICHSEIKWFDQYWNPIELQMPKLSKLAKEKLDHLTFSEEEREFVGHMLMQSYVRLRFVEDQVLDIEIQLNEGKSVEESQKLNQLFVNSCSAFGRFRLKLKCYLCTPILENITSYEAK